MKTTKNGLVFEQPSSHPADEEAFLPYVCWNGWSHPWTEEMINFLVACTYSPMKEDTNSPPAAQSHRRVYLGAEWATGVSEVDYVRAKQRIVLCALGVEYHGFVWIIPKVGKRLEPDIQELHLVLWLRGFFA